MQVTPGSRPSGLVRTVGSLWFGAVLLVLLSAAMACATVYESTYGTEGALYEFYMSKWFIALLAILGLNVFAALAMRYPFPRAKAGFVITHLSLVFVLAGAAVTKLYGVNGRLAIVEGETLDEFRISEESLTLLNRNSGASQVTKLDSAVFGGLAVEDDVRGAEVTLGDVKVEVLRYLPDAVMATEVANDSPHAATAVEVSFSESGTADPVWIFQGDTRRVGAVPVALTMVSGSEELERRLAEGAAPEGGSIGIVRIEVEETEFEHAIEECMKQACPLGGSEYTIRVLEYFHHATVGPDNKITNASDRPENPAIRAEVTGPNGTRTQTAFARFPDFGAMHGEDDAPAAKVTLVYTGGSTPTTAPVEVLTTPDGEMHVRFSQGGAETATHKLTEGKPVDAPWPGRRFAVLRRFDNARTVESVKPANPVRETRAPAALVKISNPNSTSETWVRKYNPRPVTIDGTPHQIVYADQGVPLGFDVTLTKFTVGYYPGTGRPRSFESQIAITDSASGRTQNRVISMNHPTSYGGYTFYQSSYRLLEPNALSILSVARDPGTPIVFAGYIGVMGGMLWVLVVRVVSRRRALQAQGSGEDLAGGGRMVDLMTSGARGVQSTSVPSGLREGGGDGGVGSGSKAAPSTVEEVSR